MPLEVSSEKNLRNSFYVLNNNHIMTSLKDYENQPKLRVHFMKCPERYDCNPEAVSVSSNKPELVYSSVVS
ncbi:hypothetical protein ScPMuIL_013034 [Solemya velum]